MTTQTPFSFTSPVILAFPALLEARAYQVDGKEKGEKKFGASFIFEPDHPDFKDLKAHVAKVARAKWPGRESLTGLKFPWKSGTSLNERRALKLKDAGKADDHKGDFQDGKVVLKAASKYEVKLSVLVDGRLIELEPGSAAFAAHKGKFFFGAEVLAEVNFVAYSAQKEGDPDGVTAYLQQVLSTGKGTRIGGGRTASEAFSGFVGTPSTEDPTGALDDDIPF